MLQFTINNTHRNIKIKIMKILYDYLRIVKLLKETGIILIIQFFLTEYLISIKKLLLVTTLKIYNLPIALVQSTRPNKL